MKMYVVYEKRTGRIVHLHHSVDTSGRSRDCSDEEVLSMIPEADPSALGVVEADLESGPSGREPALVIDTKSGELRRESETAAS
jgi:hypothetical protein